MDPRHTKRTKIVQNLYAYSFGSDFKKIPFKNDEKTKEVIEQISKIDELIQKNAPRYPIDKISKIDLAILRMSLYDLIVEKNQPEKVIINEAIELSKEMGGEKSYAFVNAVLGKVVNKKI